MSYSRAQHDPAARHLASAEENTTKDHVTLRKRLRKAAEREYPGRKLAWLGGILYFTDGLTPSEVPFVKQVPKPGHVTVGYLGAQLEKYGVPKVRHAAASSWW